jgi:medium-chain acyl-[acyl-carrier-protein] hydrolase
VCLPYAGGSASAFRGWGELLPEAIELCAVQLPGRENRIGELPFSRLDELVPVLARALQEEGLDIPFALFGHSMGALIGFELARHLGTTAQREPCRLIVSGCNAPGLLDPNSHLHELDDAELLRELVRLDRVAPVVLENEELSRLVLPMLRADCGIVETYRYEPSEPLRCDVSVYGGEADDLTTAAGLAAWRDHTAGDFVVQMFPGDHDFPQSMRAALVEAVAASALRSAARTPTQLRE